MLPSLRGSLISLGMLAVHVVPASAQGPGTNSTWTQLSDGPSPRAFHAMAHHGRTGRVLAVGGLDQVNGCTSEAWAWSHGAWSVLPSIPFTDRLSLAVVEDVSRGVLVCFGGLLCISGPYGGSPGYLGDTWEWDGISWSQALTPGPPERAGHAMAYDTDRGVTVLFGGVYVPYPPYGTYGADGSAYVTLTSYFSYYEDTWEFDGQTWTLVSNSGPSARSGHAMAYDAHRGRTILFGGVGESGLADGETWEWDGQEWTTTPSPGSSPTGPSPRYAHAMVYDVDLRGVVLFGGEDGTALGDTWVRKNRRWHRLEGQGPPARGAHAMVYSPSDRGLLLMGGMSSSSDTVFQDTWLWQVAPQAGARSGNR